jgi:DNA-damage-inducible protein D
MKEMSIKEWAQSMFDSIRHLDKNGKEYWSARELAEVLDYSWEGFERVITRAELSIAETGQSVEDHIRHVSKMVSIGSGSERAISDAHLNRYACYIIAQNGNAAKKPAIAGAQAYFAIQTRRQELADQREYDYERLIARQKFTESDKQISSAIMEKGISGRGLGQIKSSGDKKLFGGKSTSQMKKEYGITSSKTPLANRMPNVVLAAKSLANEMTAQNLEDYPIDSYADVLIENNGNNEEVRKTLITRGIVPESLPPAEDTDKIMTRLKSDDKRRAIEES